MVGRPKKIIEISTGKISKQERESRAKLEKDLKVDRNLTAPKWLNKKAKDEFNRVVDSAKKLNFLDDLDLSILAVYANAYVSYVEVSKEISLKGFVIEKQSGELVTNPLVNIQEKYAKQIFNCSSKLGLATTDRLRLIVPVKEDKEVNKFVKFL